MSEAVFCEEYVVLLEAIRDALVDIEDEPMSKVRAMVDRRSRGTLRARPSARR
jgi:hypothetical protein